MKQIVLIIAVLLLLPIAVSSQVSFGQPEKVNDNWKFKLLKEFPTGETEKTEGQSISLVDTAWQQVNLPHDWSVKAQLSPSLASATGYLPGGTGWYRKTIHIPETKKDEKVYLYFEGVYNRSEVYINGELLGKRPNGYVSFMYDATPFVEYGKDNVIAVYIDHSQSVDSRWYTGSGIYRDVYLIYANPLHIAQWGVYAYPKNVSKSEGILSVEVEVENNTNANTSVTINNELISPAGKVVARNSKKLAVIADQNNKVTIDLKINNPQLWDLDNPQLYQLKTTVLQGGKMIDETTTRTGFRSFTFDPDKGFALNGQWMKVKGVCIHHDAGVLGAEFYPQVWRERLNTLKEIGCNAIRTSHNAHAPALYDLCDELGLLVMDEVFDEWEFPKRKWVEGWNIGTPGFQGSFDYFKDWGKRDLADVVRRDRNHLSVFVWSIGNEIDYPNDPYSHPVLDGGESTDFTQPIFGGYQEDAPDANHLGSIAKDLVATVKEYDSSRPTTAGLAGVVMSNATEYPGALDIAGYNYTESLYQSDHKKYPKRIIYGSENRHDMEAWKAVRDNEHIFGQFLWTGIDYLGESGKWPARGSSAGLTDLAGFIKPRGYFRLALWSDKPMTYLGTYLIHRNETKEDAWPVWNYEDGQLIRVICYTNLPKARLELNGKVIGDIKKQDDNTGLIYWDIPYADGKLEVIGLDKNDEEATRYVIQSSQQPYALTIQSVDKSISKNKDLAQIVVQVVDENGVPVMISDNEITCEVAGPAKLLGLEAGNIKDISDYTDNTHRAYHGRILAYIQSTGEEGNIHIRFTSPWLKPTETTISVK